MTLHLLHDRAAIYREFRAGRSMREIAAISSLKIAQVEQIIREVLATREKRADHGSCSEQIGLCSRADSTCAGPIVYAEGVVYNDQVHGQVFMLCEQHAADEKRNYKHDQPTST